MQPFGRRGIIARLAAVFAFTAVVCLRAQAQEPVYSADEVKAAFLYHFGTYVQWPQAARRGDAITIAVLGAPAVAAQLEAFLSNRTIQGRPVRARRLQRIQDLGSDEVVFIGADHNNQLADIVKAVAGRPTLVVTDAPNGLDRGSMVNFQVVGERVRFEISLAKAEEAGLALSSRLLSVALRVQTSSSAPNAIWPAAMLTYSPLDA